MYKLGNRTLHLSPNFADGWIGIDGWFTISYKRVSPSSFLYRTKESL